MRRGAFARLAPWLLLVMAAPARALEVQSVEVTQAQGRYRVHMQVQLDAPARASWATFANPLNLPRINPAVREVRVLDMQGAHPARLYTRVKICIAWICRQLEQVQDMQYTARDEGGEMRATVRPELSDFRHGRAQWSFRDCAPRTCLRFDAELEPAFWVPPLIGPWLIRDTLRDEAITTSRGLERLASTATP